MLDSEIANHGKAIVGSSAYQTCYVANVCISGIKETLYFGSYNMYIYLIYLCIYLLIIEMHGYYIVDIII